jgi:molybdopterin-guanine dinucleotide biosynthesis protein A
VRLAAVILAGGSGERLGTVVKATLRFGNRRLVDLVDARLAAAETRLLSCGRHDPSGWHLPAHLIPLPDLPFETFGPLAGLAAATHWAAAQLSPPEAILLVPVDSPLLPDDMLPRLVAALADAPAVLASFGGQSYPTSSIWRLAAVADLPQQLAAGQAPRSLHRLAETLGAKDLPFPATTDGGDPFANLNTLADLVALERRVLLR